MGGWRVRVALAVLAALGAALMGRSLAAACARRGRTLRQAMDALQHLRIEMLERRLPLHAALSHARFDVLRRVGGRMAAGGPAAEAWQTLLPSLTRRGGALDSLTREDISALTTFFDGLGAGTRTAQEALFLSTTRELGRLEAEAAKNGAEKGKLYATLGLLFGLMLAIAFV